MDDCPVCGNKTRTNDTGRYGMKKFPLYYPKCKQETLLEAKNFQITVIKTPDEKTQSR